MDRFVEDEARWLSDGLAHVSVPRATVVRTKSDTYAFPKHHPFDMCHIDMYVMHQNHGGLCSKHTYDGRDA